MTIKSTSSSQSTKLNLPEELLMLLLTLQPHTELYFI